MSENTVLRKVKKHAAGFTDRLVRRRARIPPAASAAAFRPDGADAELKFYTRRCCVVYVIALFDLFDFYVRTYWCWYTCEEKNRSEDTESVKNG